MAKSLAQVLDEFKEYVSLTESGTRIKCLITAHEMPARADAVLAYLNGKRFKKAKEWYTQDFSKYLPYIIPYKKNPAKLFCKLTRLQLNKIPREIEKHTQGKRYQRLKENFERRQSRQSVHSDEDDDQEEDEGDEVGEEDIDVEDEDDLETAVEEEKIAAAAAGIWMPEDELKKIVGGVKTKGTKRKPVGQDVGSNAAQDSENEGEAVRGSDQQFEDDADEEIDSDGSDADLKYYIREKPVAVKKHSKGKDGDKGNSTAPDSTDTKAKHGKGGKTESSNSTSKRSKK